MRNQTLRKRHLGRAMSAPGCRSASGLATGRAPTLNIRKGVDCGNDGRQKWPSACPSISQASQTRRDAGYVDLRRHLHASHIDGSHLACYIFISHVVNGGNVGVSARSRQTVDAERVWEKSRGGCGLNDMYRYEGAPELRPHQPQLLGAAAANFGPFPLSFRLLSLLVGGAVPAPRLA